MSSLPATLLPLTIETDGPAAGVYTLTLEQPGKSVVVLDRELIRSLEATLKTVPRSARGLIVRSASERVFVAGADLKAISELTDEQLETYLHYGSEVFSRLSQLPCVTVAAINGAALGGGLELAMHCDALVGAPSPSGKPYLVGLPEAGLKICPGWGGTNLLPARIDPEIAIQATMTGTPMNSDAAREAGLFDAFAATAADLLQTARNWIISNPTTPPRDEAPTHWIGRLANRASNARRDVTTKSLSAADLLAASPSVTEAPPASGLLGAPVQGMPPAAAVLAAVNAGLSNGWQAALTVERRELIRLRTAPAGKAAIHAFLNRK